MGRTLRHKQLQKLAGEHEVCRRLMTVPGVGPVPALRYVATIDEPAAAVLSELLDRVRAVEHERGAERARTGDACWGDAP